MSGDITPAIIGLIGVVVGGGIGGAKDFVAHWAGRRRRGRYAAVRVICVLDEYVQKCVEVVGDDGTLYGRPAGQTASGEEYLQAQVSLPPPPAFPSDVDWTSIEVGLMYRILALPNLANETDRIIAAASEHASLPDYEEYFEARWEGYADLGLEALSLTESLRSSFKLPEIEVKMNDSGWDAKEFFKKEKLAIQQRKDSARASAAEMIAELDRLAEGNK